MTTLGQALNDYLRLRRRMGYALERDQLLLEQFVVFLEQADAQRITTELALQWARIPANQHPVNWRRRLGMVRQFARYLATVDPLSEIPSRDLLPAQQPRTAPYIYTRQQIEALMAAARSLPGPLPAATYATVIGLLASTGIRLREALALDCADVDLQDGVLDIRASMNHRQREVPLHPSTSAALTSYTIVRNGHNKSTATPSFFVTARGRRPVQTVFWQTFRMLIAQAGMEGRGHRVRPRPHDLRHTFAVKTLIGWYRSGEDVDRKMPNLSTYLGHVSPESTYWYLQSVPELQALVSERLGQIGEVLS
jgi:integrase/recombinase XerD